MNLTKISVDRPITTIMASLIVIVISAVAFSRLPIDLMPDVSYPSITVSMTYDGAAPEEIETLLARPMEQALGSVSNIDRIDSSCEEGRALIRLRFEWGSNLEDVVNDVRQRVDRIRGAVPEGADPPVIYRYDFRQSPILRLGVAADMAPKDLRRLADDYLKPRFERVVGVAAAEVEGGLRREIQVNLNSARLNAVNMTPGMVVARIREENLDLPAGEVQEGDLELMVRTKGQFSSVADLDRIIVATRDGVPIYLRDVAEVVDGLEEERQVFRINGENGIRLSIVKQSTSNTVEVARLVQEEAQRLMLDRPDLTVATLFDSSHFIEDAIAGVRSAAISGSILALVILIVFLRNLRSTFIVAMSIPFAVMASFALIYFAGFTLNIVSFGGLAIGIGMLVDNSIVVLENIFRHREAGMSGREAALKGTSEVTLPIVASTLTTIVVFVPLLFLTGPAKIMFGQLSYVVSFSLICSLVVALTLIPMLCSRLLVVESREAMQNETIRHRIYRIGAAVLDSVDYAYRGLLDRALKHRFAVLAGSMILLGVAIPFGRIIPFEYMPTSDQDEVDVDAEMDPGTSLAVMDARFTRIENIIRETIPGEFRHLETSFGLSTSMRGGASNEGEVEVGLLPASERTLSSDEIAAKLRDALADMDSMRIRTRPGGGLFIFRMMEGDDSISIDIRGYDRAEAERIALEVAEKLESIPGVAGVRQGQQQAQPVLGLNIDRAKAADAGLSVSQIARELRTNFGGDIATRYREGGDEYEVMVRLREEDRLTSEDLGDLWMVTPSGARVPISNFLSQKRDTGPTRINRVDQQRSVTVTAGLEPEATLGNVMQVVRRELADIEMPEDFSLVYGGEYKDQVESYRQLAVGMLLAFVLVYMVMAAQFESLIHPLIIMFAIPFAAIGVILALVATETTLNIQSILGMTMLGGIVVNNAIILIDYTNLLRREHGYSLIEAVEEAGRHRLRPILMTTSTTLLGLAPMAIGVGSGSELQAPMARVVVGGLTTSTLITLVFVPVLYVVVEEFLARFRRTAAASEPAPLDDSTAIAK